MSSQGPSFCSSVSQITGSFTGYGVDFGGSGSSLASWTNPQYVETGTASNYATANMSNSLPWSALLLCTGFGFTIPNGATINGITVTYVGHVSSVTHISKDVIQLLQASLPVGTDKTNTTFSLTDETITFGNATDLWGAVWTPALINAAGFGLVYQAQEANSNITESVLSFQITVNYTGGVQSSTVVISPVTKLLLGQCN